MLLYGVHLYFIVHINSRDHRHHDLVVPGIIVVVAVVVIVVLNLDRHRHR